MYLLSYLKDQFGKELVVAIIPAISSKKENHFWSFRLLSEGRYFCHFLTPVKFYFYFWNLTVVQSKLS